MNPLFPLQSNLKESQKNEKTLEDAAVKMMPSSRPKKGFLQE